MLSIEFSMKYSVISLEPIENALTISLTFQSLNISLLILPLVVAAPQNDIAGNGLSNALNLFSI